MFSLAFTIFILATLVLGEPVEFLSDEYIANLNKEGLPWKAGRNFDPNLTKDDIIRMFGERPERIPEVPMTRRISYVNDQSSFGVPIPSEFDARRVFRKCSEIISTVPDQGACASSYAFAIASVASDRLCIHSEAEVKTPLSAEYITACCKICRYPSATKICSSGLSSYTWRFVHKRGLVTGGSYKSNIGCQPVSFSGCNHGTSRTSQPFCKDVQTPQPKCHTRCLNEDYETGFFKDKHRFRKFYWLSERVDDIQREIMKNGPVVANIYIYSDLLNYRSGVYRVSGSAQIQAYASVKIIGWGVEGTLPYWLVTSTFGDQFGDYNGVIKVLRGRNEIIIEELVSGVIPKGPHIKPRPGSTEEVEEEPEVEEEEEPEVEEEEEEEEFDL